MRPFEIALSVANIVTLASLSIRPLRLIPWTGFAALFTALIAATQVLVEGQRWQMSFAYTLAAAFFLIWLLGTVAPVRVKVSRAVTGVGTGFGGLVLVVSMALPIARPVFRFPRPTGPYAIGSLTYHWVDSSRPEFFAADPKERRELMAQLWYPARDDPSAKHVSYMEDAAAITMAMSRIVGLPRFFLAHFKYVTTDAVQSAPVTDDKTVFPVLIFLSGLGGFRGSNTYQIQELVSHGYIVVGLDQPGASSAVRFRDGRQVVVLPRGEIQPLIQQSTSPTQDAPVLNGHALPNGIIPYFAQDARFAMDRLTALNENDPCGRLTGRLDLGRVGVFGTSLGAIVAGEASLMDARIKASLMMDAAMPADVVRAGLRQPCMWITRPAGDMRLERSRSGGWPEAAIVETLTTMRAVFNRHAPGSAYYLEMPGMFHINFTDAPFWSPITSQVGLTGPVDGKRMWDVVNAYSLAFFDKYLKGRAEALLDAPGHQYPEVIFERR